MQLQEKKPYVYIGQIMIMTQVCDMRGSWYDTG